MKTLERDKRTFYYCKLNKKEPMTDTNGYMTGEFKLTYDNPVMMRASIGAGSGQGSFTKYGTSQVYDKTIETDDTENILPEGTILFIKNEVAFDDYGVPLGDWVVMRAIESINSITYGLERIR